MTIFLILDISTFSVVEIPSSGKSDRNYMNLPEKKRYITLIKVLTAKVRIGRIKPSLPFEISGESSDKHI